MLIAQISDTHIAGRGKKTYGVAPMSQNLSQCVGHINQLKPEVDLVLVTGDISCSGQPEEFNEAAELLNKLDAPYFVIPGNHDDCLNLLSVFRGKACTSINLGKDREFINYVIDDFDIRLIAMDSTIINEPGGEVCEARATWLNERLSEDREKPTIIFMHHPPIKLGVKETNVDGFTGSERLGEVVKKYFNIERIICGHIHLPTFTRWCGTIVSTAPATGMPLILDLTLKQPSQLMMR